MSCCRSKIVGVAYTLLMLTISADEMQRDLPAYLKLVQSGETLLITQADKLVAEVKTASPANKQPRPSGLAKGEFVVPDDFDAPLPDELWNSGN